MGNFLFAKNKFIVKEEIDNHDNNGVESKGAGGEDKLVGEGQVYGASDIVDKLIKESKKAKKLSKAWGDGDGEHGVPDEKSDNGVPSDRAFFPGDSGMCKISDYGGDGGSNKIGEPDEIVILNDEIG